MNNNPEVLIAKKIIQKEMLNELVRIDLVDFLDSSRITKKLDEDIRRLKEGQEKDKDIKNIIIKIPI